MKPLNLLGKLGLTSCVATKCGHKTKKNGKVTAFGEAITTNINGDSVEYCHECLGRMAIRCAWCGKPIFIGDPVTLYIANSSEMPDYAVFYDDENREAHNKPDSVEVVGCLRFSCADTGADKAGYWVPGDNNKGKVHLARSAYEIALSDAADDL